MRIGFRYNVIRPIAYLTSLTLAVPLLSAHAAQAQTLNATFNTPTDVPVTANGYTASGTVNFTLNCALPTGTNLTVVNNTGLGFINGTFSNLAQGQAVAFTYNGVVYDFVANYFGGTGNDLVLQWATNRPVGWGLDNYSQLGNNNPQNVLLPVGVNTSGALAGKTVTAVAAGGSHTLALCSDGTVAAWGYNNSGQLGNGTLINSAVPVAVTTTGTALAGKTVVAIAAGTNHSLALCSDGTVAAWGFGGDGEMGNNTMGAPNPLPGAVLTTGTALAGKTVKAIAAGGSHCLALCTDGTVAAWGFNIDGQLGNGNTINTYSVPVSVSTAGTALAGKTVTAVAGGGSHSLALCSDGTVAAWGDNLYGELGNGTNTQSSVAVLVVTGGKTVTKISANLGFHSLALCSDGTLFAWGYNLNGQLGDNNTNNSSAPVTVTTTGVLSSKTISSMVAGYNQSLALCSDGTVASWGSNGYGLLGNGNTTSSSVPIAVITAGTSLAGKTVVALASGQDHNAVLCSDGTVSNWGYNFYGQLGNGAMNAPVAVATTTAGTPLAGKTIVAESAGASHSLALCSDGTVVAWGYNNSGQLGNVTATSTLVPVAVTTTGVLSGKTVVAISAGYSHSLALCSDGTVAAWGYNGNGQLGNNSTFQSTVPVLVTTTGTALAGKTVVAIAACGGGGGSHSLALCSDGTVVAWGYNFYGQLGNGSTTQSLTAKAVSTSGVLSGKTVIAITGGTLHSLALCSDGTLAAWGINNNGQLGNNSTNNSSVPVAVTTSGVLSGKTVSAISGGYAHNLALCSDGTAAAWGYNNNGQLGNNSTTDSSVPAAVTGGVLSGKTVTHVSAGFYHSLAQCSDGSTAAWGYDGDGELGNNSTATSLVPVAVSAASLAAGERFVFEASGPTADHSLGIVAEPVFPVVNTLAAASVTNTTATLNALVNPDGNSTTVNFQYGSTTAYGSTTQNQAAGSGGSFVSVNAPLSGFSGHTTYHYCITAANAAGTATGADMTFTTLDTPPVANADSASNVSGPVTINVLGNDTDADGDALTITAVTQGASGSVSTDGNTVTYTPGSSFSSADTFSYTISDGFGGTAAASVTVNAAAIVTWRAQTFGANASNSTISGDNADPNNNGIPNLMEYALHGDAVGNSTGAGILPQVSANPSTGTLQLSFTRYQDRTDITLIVQAADSLGSGTTWTNLAQSVDGAPFTIITTGATVNESGSGNAISVTVGDLYQMTDPNHPQRFMRLMVTRP